MKTLNEEQRHTIAKALKTNGLITVLTGAGISADSGIPTFRGPEGYWTIGSKNYMPTEMATQAMLHQNPEEVWKWYIFRFGACADALPNPGHVAIAEMEELLGDRFRLITQNIDGLHLQAGNSKERTFQIHGNLNFMRCRQECTTEVYPLPIKRLVKEKFSDLSQSEWEILKCPACGSITRPHVLFFDEYYDEHHYKFESTLEVSENTALLVVVGTTGSTNLPNQVVNTVLRMGGTILNINIEANIFSKAALRSPDGLFLQGSSSILLPDLVDCMKDCLAARS
jgi:NAD-dependent protein deacetylase/lipoamidase